MMGETDGSDGDVPNLDAEGGIALLEQDVPDVQNSVRLHREEDSWSDGTPAGVHQPGRLVPEPPAGPLRTVGQEALSGFGTDLVDMMDDSLMSSDQMRATQSPTVRKFLGKKGFLCRA